MKRLFAMLLALVMTMSLTVCVFGESIAESEVVQCNSAEEFRYNYDDGIVLLDTDDIYISAAWLDYKNTDEGMGLQFYLAFENLSDQTLNLSVTSLNENAGRPWGRDFQAGKSMRQCVTGTVYDWNCLLGETDDCYQGTYQLDVMIDEEIVASVQFDWYASEKTPLVNIIRGEIGEDGAMIASEEETEVVETVLADEEFFRITAGKHSNSVLPITLENKSDRTLSFTSCEGDGLVNTVNGYHSDLGIYEVVDPGESVKTEIPLGLSEMGMMIKKVVDVQHGIQIRDKDTYELIANVPIHVQDTETDYDYSSESFQEVVQDPQFSNDFYNLEYFTDEVAFDCCGIQVLSAAVISRSGTPYLYLELENSTENNLRFYSKALALNDLYITFGIQSVLVPAGKKSISKSMLTPRLDDDLTAQLGLDEISTCGIIGAVTTEDTNGLMNLSEPLGSETFTIQISDEEKTFTCGEMTEVINQAGIQFNVVSMYDKENGDIELLLLVVNNSGYDVDLDTAMEGMVNEKPIYLSSREPDLLPNGATGLMTITLQASSLEEIGITGADVITDLNVQLYVKETDTRSTILETPFVLNGWNN